jgi:hypothetical protein
MRGPALVGTLLISEFETTGASNEKASTKVPAIPSSRMFTFCANPYPGPVTHFTAEEVTQTLVSHAPDPMIEVGVISVGAKLEPMMVNDAPPVMGPFSGVEMSDTVGASYVNIPAAVPINEPTVITTSCVVPTPIGV